MTKITIYIKKKNNHILFDVIELKNIDKGKKIKQKSLRIELQQKRNQIGPNKKKRKRLYYYN